MRLGNDGATITAAVFESGVWRQTPFGMLRVRLRHPTSISYRRAIREFRSEFDAQPDEVEKEELYRRAIVIASIVDIEDAVDVEGNNLEYSKELITQIVNNPDNKPFTDWVADEVISLGNANDFEKLIKNLQNAFPGD